MSTLIAAKRELFLEEIDAVDGRDLMNPEASKWIHVSQYVMRAGHRSCMRDGPACKGKWNQLIPDYKRIADFQARTERNAIEYWELSSSEHTAEGLPKMFSRELYNQIHEWFGQRPQIQPPHIWDLLAPHDANHPGVHALQLSDDEGSGDSHPESDNHATVELSDSQPLPSLEQSPLHPLEAPSMGGEGDSQRPSPSPARSSPTPIQRSQGGFACGPSSRRTHFPPSSAQAPVYISSSDASEFSSGNVQGIVECGGNCSLATMS
jgi:hypothetical protein